MVIRNTRQISQLEICALARPRSFGLRPKTMPARAVRRFLVIILWLPISLPAFLIGCGYGFSTVRGPLPGGVKKVAIPIFQNRTHEAGVENVFTSLLRDEFFRSKLVDVVDRNKADAKIVGIINSVSIEAVAHTERDLEGRAKKILANEYNARADVSISLIRLRDGEKLWQRTISDARRYVADDNLLKNEVKQQEAFQKVAVYLMEQAHDLMFEDF